MLKRSTSRSNWNLEVFIFVEEGKPENPEKNPRSRERTNDETLSSGIEPGSEVRGERISTAPNGMDHIMRLELVLASHNFSIELISR